MSFRASAASRGISRPPTEISLSARVEIPRLAFGSLGMARSIATTSNPLYYMRLYGLVAAVFVLASCTHPAASGAPTPSGGSYDVVIVNGKIVDGTGNPWTY